MIRHLFEMLVVLVLAVALVLAVRFSDGYVVLVSPPWRVELSLPLMLFLLLAGFVVLHVSLSVLHHLVALPGKVRDFKHAQRSKDATRLSTEAALAYLSGRFKEAGNMAEMALAAGESSQLNILLAARAAEAQGEIARRDHFLELAGLPPAHASGDNPASPIELPEKREIQTPRPFPGP